MSILRNLFLLGIVGGVGAYYYDLNAAKRITVKAEIVNIDTELRCRYNLESMCKYFVTAKIKKENLEYQFRIPPSYYYQKHFQTGQSVKVILKTKKIFPMKIMGLDPKLDKELNDLIAKEVQ